MTKRRKCSLNSFDQSWTTDIKVPVTWTSEQITNFNYEVIYTYDRPKAKTLAQEGTTIGPDSVVVGNSAWTIYHHELWTVYNEADGTRHDVGGYGSAFTLRDNAHPWLEETIRTFPNADYAAYRFQKQRSGNIWGIHIDDNLDGLYKDLWKQRFNIEPPGLKHWFQMRKAVIFLEDHKPGHFAVCDNKMIYDWKAGDGYCFSKKVPHAAGNFNRRIPRHVLTVDFYLT